MANYLVTDEQLTATADAIREKTGGTDLLTWDESKGFSDAVSGISAGGGGNEMLDGVISGRATEIKSNTEQIREYAFYYYDKLESVNFPLAKGVAKGAFQNCTALKSVNMPLVNTAASHIFNACKSLTSVNFPLLKGLNGSSFSSCEALTTVNLPMLEKLSTYDFSGCKALKTLDLALLKTIPDLVFIASMVLDTIILRKSDEICSLSNIGTFNSTPFYTNGTGGTVYVPSALITEYQNATNWSTLYAAGTCNFVAIEGSEYE